MTLLFPQFVTRTSTNMSQNETDLIIEASEKIDEEIDLLHQKRARLRGKLNEHLSATRNLPPEVLTEIFRLSACRLNPREPQLYSIKIHMLLRLGSICSHWRSIIWSAPSLWTTCLLEQDDPIPPLIVALVFSNAGSGCVSIEVNLDDIPHESMLLIFQRHRARIRALRIQLSCVDSMDNRWNQLAPYFSQPTEWPNLTELWVRTPSWEMYPGLMLQISGVDSFHYCRRKRDNLAWCAPMHQLTILRLYNNQIDQCLYLLFHCPNLIEFHCSVERANTRTIFPPEAIFSPSRTPKICTNLRLFHWKAEDEDWNRFLFSSIRFPNLEKLSWRVPHSSLRRPGSTESIDRVLINEFIPSLSHITALDWDIPSLSYSCFNEVFSRTDLNSLQRLFILPPYYSEVVSWLKALTIDRRRANCFLPQLQTCHIKTRKADLGEPIVFETLYDCLRSRRLPLEDDGESGVIQALGHNNICALLKNFIWEGSLCLEQHQMDALKGLINGGLDFDIVPLPEFD